LVEAIASRVRARMGGSDAPLVSDRPSHCEGCHSCSLPLSVCDSCGLNPISQLAPVFQAPAIIPKPAEMAKYIDHTHLKPEADRDTIERLYRGALRIFSVCVNSGNVNLASRFLAGSSVRCAPS
jgi:hypothetical protein